MFLSKYGVARHIYIPIVKRGVVDFAVSADWTPASGDVKISKDGGAAANVTNLPTAITMGNAAMWDFSITATEMQAAQIKITVADSATKAVEDTMFVIETYGHASAQHEADFDTAACGALMPTTAGRTLDVTATGGAGIDWSNVEAPTTTLNLSGTTIAVTQKVDVDTIKTNPVVNAGTITFPTTATLASTTNITAGTITTATNVTTVNGLASGVITAASIAADAITAAKIADGAIDAATFAAGAINRATFAADTGLQTIRSNTAQAGSGTTITLDASASAVDSFYVNDLVYITGGTGVGQTRFITAYVGATKVATVATWTTNPDNTSTFAILPFDAIPGASAPTAAQVATAVWQDSTAGDFTTANSIGKSLYNAFTSNTSVFTTASLVNAPTGGSAPTAAQIATAVWQDTTAGDFTVASSIGKSLYTSGAVPGAANGLLIAGSNAATTFATLTSTGAFTINGVSNVSQTGDSFARIGANGASLTSVGLAGTQTFNNTGTWTGNITGSLSGSVGSVSGAVGSVTGNVGGNVTGSVGSVVGAVGSVTGNVGGNVTGSVGSVVGAVGSVTGNVGGNVTGSVASVVGNVGGNVVGSVASVTSRVTANTDQIDGSATAATNQKNAATVVYTGTVTGTSTTTTIVDSGLSQSAADFWKGRIVLFLTGSLKYQGTSITASVAGTLTVDTLTSAPQVGDSYVVV